MDEKRGFFIPSADGIHSIHTVIWPCDGKARGVVQLTHGLSEYILRYNAFARFLNENGFHVIGHDHLGHGQSVAGSGEYGCFPEKDGWNIANDDLHRVRERAAREWPGLPHILIGHSMGSFQARTYLIRYPGTVDGCVLLGTGQESETILASGKALAETICKIKGPHHVSKIIMHFSMEAYNRQFAPNRTSADWLSRDEAQVDLIRKDPLCHFSPTVGLFRDMLGGLQDSARYDELLKMERSVPVALFSGSEDPVGSNGKGVKKVYDLLREAGCTDVTMKLYPGARHNLLSERNREEVCGDILAWLEGHLPR